MVMGPDRRPGSPAPPTSSPAHLHLLLLLHCLFLALASSRGLCFQLLQFQLQLLAGSHSQCPLLPFLIPLHLCVSQLGAGSERLEVMAPRFLLCDSSYLGLFGPSSLLPCFISISFITFQTLPSPRSHSSKHWLFSGVTLSAISKPDQLNGLPSWTGSFLWSLHALSI